MIENSVRRLNFLKDVFNTMSEDKKEEDPLVEMAQDFMPRIIRDLEGGFAMLKEKIREMEGA